MRYRAFVRIRPGDETSTDPVEVLADEDELFEEAMALARAPLPPEVEEAA